MPSLDKTDRRLDYGLSASPWAARSRPGPALPSLGERAPRPHRSLQARRDRALLPERPAPHYGRWMRIAAFPDEIIAPTMGHADTRMLERVYGKLSPEELSSRLLLHARAALPDCIANASVGTELAGNSRQAGRAGIANPSELVPRDGIEPPTRGLTVRGGKWPTPRDDTECGTCGGPLQHKLSSRSRLHGTVLRLLRAATSPWAAWPGARSGGVQIESHLGISRRSRSNVYAQVGPVRVALVLETFWRRRALRTTYWYRRTTTDSPLRRALCVKRRRVSRFLNRAER
jgi:hypothetical protein